MRALKILPRRHNHHTAAITPSIRSLTALANVKGIEPLTMAAIAHA